MFGTYVNISQTSNSGCGPAVLRGQLLHHGMPLVGEHEVRKLAGTNTAGTPLLGMQYAARKLGFLAEVIECRGDATYEDFRQLDFPVIAPLDANDGTGHYVIIHHVSGRKGLLVADPAFGVERMSWPSFFSRWSKELLLLQPDFRHDFDVQPSQTQTGWRLTCRLLILYRAHLAIGGLCSLMQTLLSVVALLMLRYFVDALARGRDLLLLHELAIGMTVVILFRALFDLVSWYLRADLSRCIQLRLRSIVVRRLPYWADTVFQARSRSELQARCGTDVLKAREACVAALDVLTCAIRILVLMGPIWFVSQGLLTLAIVCLPVLLLFGLAQARANHKCKKQLSNATSRLDAHIAETTSKSREFKLSGQQDMRRLEAESLLVQQSRLGFALQMRKAMNTVGGFLVSGLIVVLTLVVGGKAVTSGSMTIGQLLFAYFLFCPAFAALRQFTKSWQPIADGLSAGDRLCDILREPVESEEDTKPRATFSATSGIRFEDATIRDHALVEPDLDQVTFHVTAGSTVALIDPMGLATQAIANVLTRMRETTSGNVLVDDLNIRDLHRDSCRSGVAWITARSPQWNRTVAEALTGLEQPDWNAMIEAAKKARLHDSISRLPDGYATIVGSNGFKLPKEHQCKLSIAQALYKNAKILILEAPLGYPGSSLHDLYLDLVERVWRDNTVLILAHDPSHVPMACRTLVFNEGKIVNDFSPHRTS